MGRQQMIRCLQVKNVVTVHMGHSPENGDIYGCYIAKMPKNHYKI